MPLYQNSTVSTNDLILGNYKIETSASSGGTYVNLGAGTVNGFAHLPEYYTSQAGNSPDPLEGIAAETFTVDFELLEWDGSVLSAIQGGAVSESSTTTLSTMKGGGNQTITLRAFKLTNTRLVGTTTTETILTLFKARMANGLAITAKSDNDSDPINVIPCSLLAKIDASLSAGSQLFTITRTKVE